MTTPLRDRVTIEPAANLAAAQAIDCTNVGDSSTLNIKTLGNFVYDAASTDTADNNNVIEPTVGGGRFKRTAKQFLTVDPSGLIEQSNIAGTFGSPFVTVGTGGDYAEVNLAAAAGEFNVIVISDVTETADTLFTAKRGSLLTLGGFEVNFGNNSVVFSATESVYRVNGIVRWSHTSAGGLFNAAAANYSSVVDINHATLFNTSTANGAAIYQNISCTMENVLIECANVNSCVVNSTNSAFERLNISDTRVIGGGPACGTPIITGGTTKINGLLMDGQYAGSTDLIDCLDEATITNVTFNHGGSAANCKPRGGVSNITNKSFQPMNIIADDTLGLSLSNVSMEGSNSGVFFGGVSSGKYSLTNCNFTGSIFLDGNGSVFVANSRCSFMEIRSPNNKLVNIDSSDAILLPAGTSTNNELVNVSSGLFFSLTDATENTFTNCKGTTLTVGQTSGPAGGNTFSGCKFTTSAAINDGDANRMVNCTIGSSGSGTLTIAAAADRTVVGSNSTGVAIVDNSATSLLSNNGLI